MQKQENLLTRPVIIVTQEEAEKTEKGRAKKQKLGTLKQRKYVILLLQLLENTFGMQWQPM